MFWEDRKIISYTGCLTSVPKGEKIKLSVHFNNLHFGLNHVFNFVLESQIDGWYVTFEKNTFTTASIVCNNERAYKMAYMYCFTNVNAYNKLSWQKG